jgi:hypothetical protein
MSPKFRSLYDATHDEWAWTNDSWHALSDGTPKEPHEPGENPTQVWHIDVGPDGVAYTYCKTVEGVDGFGYLSVGELPANARRSRARKARRKR